MSDREEDEQQDSIQEGTPDREETLTVLEDQIRMSTRSPFRNFSADSGLEVLQGPSNGGRNLTNQSGSLGGFDTPINKTSEVLTNTSPVIMLSANAQYMTNIGSQGHLFQSMLMCLAQAQFGSSLVAEYTKKFEQRKEEEIRARDEVERLERDLKVAKENYQAATSKRKAADDCLKFLESKRRTKDKLMSMVDDDSYELVPDDLKEIFQPVNLTLSGGPLC